MYRILFNVKIFRLHEFVVGDNRMYNNRSRTVVGIFHNRNPGPQWPSG